MGQDRTALEHRRARGVTADAHIPPAKRAANEVRSKIRCCPAEFLSRVQTTRGGVLCAEERVSGRA